MGVKELRILDPYTHALNNVTTLKKQYLITFLHLPNFVSLKHFQLVHVCICSKWSKEVCTLTYQSVIEGRSLSVLVGRTGNFLRSALAASSLKGD